MPPEGINKEDIVNASGFDLPKVVETKPAYDDTKLEDRGSSLSLNEIKIDEIAKTEIRSAYDSTKLDNIKGARLSLKTVLSTLSNDQNWDKAYVRVRQSNRYFFGLLKRNHATLLELTKDPEKKNITAHFYDPKGFLSRLYPLTNIKNAVKEVFGETTPFETTYLGHQRTNDYSKSRELVNKYIHDLKIADHIGDYGVLSRGFQAVTEKFKTYNKFYNKIISRITGIFTKRGQKNQQESKETEPSTPYPTTGGLSDLIVFPETIDEIIKINVPPSMKKEVVGKQPVVQATEGENQNIRHTPTKDKPDNDNLPLTEEEFATQIEKQVDEIQKYIPLFNFTVVDKKSEVTISTPNIPKAEELPNLQTIPQRVVPMAKPGTSGPDIASSVPEQPALSRALAQKEQINPPQQNTSNNSPASHRSAKTKVTFVRKEEERKTGETKNKTPVTRLPGFQ